jgi:uncharacterized membrane protein YqhA
MMENFMVGTLLVIVSVGGFHVYVLPIFPKNSWLPGWLKNMTPVDLEVATACNLAGVSLMVMLQDLYNPPGWSILGQHVVLHFTFLGTAKLLTTLRH